MADFRQSSPDALVETVKQHYEGMQKSVAEAESIPKQRDKPSNRKENGQFGIGNRAGTGGKPKGLVEYVKSMTNNYQDLIDLFLKGAAGKSIDGHTPTFRERVDCANALLDRTIGKPTQMVIQNSDDTAKQMMADRVRLSVLEQERRLAEAKQKSVEESVPAENVSPINSMRRR